MTVWHLTRPSYDAAWITGVLVAALLMAAALVTPARADSPPPNVPVTPDGGSLAFQDPTLAVDPTDHAHLAMAYYEFSKDRQCLLALSSDAGKNWTTKVVVGDGGQIPLTGEQVKCYSPKVAYGPSGVIYYVYQAARAPGSKPRQVLIATSRDGGATFGAPVLLGPMTDRIVNQQVAVTVDQTSGRVYAGWADITDPANPRVLVASSTDEGRTFVAPVQANPADQPFPEGPDEPTLVVDRDRTLHVGWRVFLESSPTVTFFVATSGNQGQTFGPATTALSNLDGGCGGAGCRRPVEYAADNVSHDLARGASPGQLFAVGWAPEGGVPTNNRRLVFAASQDGGASWSAARVVGIPAGREGDDQARPSLTVTAGGRIEIVYQDISATEGGTQNIFEIHSDDGGATFSAPAQLNAAPSDIRVGPPSFSSFNGGNTAALGAHSGLAFSESAVFTAWTDTRRGTLDTPKQDIFFAALPLPVAAPPPPEEIPPVLTPPVIGVAPSGCGKFTSKLSVARATFSRADRSISILAPITGLASGSVQVTLDAAGRTTTFNAAIDSRRARIRVTRHIPAAQARLGSGILTIRYRGDADTRPQTVRIRAANNPARLTVTRPTITATGLLRAGGTVTRSARGVVRVQLEYVNRSDGQTVTLERSAVIKNGRWSLNSELSPSLRTQIAQRCGTVHSYIAFTGYFRRRIRGEQRSLQVLPSQ